MRRAGTLDPQSDFQFAYSKVPSSEIARCKPLDRTAISEELRRLWDALSDDQRKVYDQKADELRGEMARERLIAARTARDRAVEAALELGAKDRDARLIAARQTKQLFLFLGVLAGRRLLTGKPMLGTSERLIYRSIQRVLARDVTLSPMLVTQRILEIASQDLSQPGSPLGIRLATELVPLRMRV